MNNEQYNIQAKLEKWAKETVEVYKKQSTEIGFYTQTPLSIFLKDNIQFGNKPWLWRGYKKEYRNRIA